MKQLRIAAPALLLLALFAGVVDAQKKPSRRSSTKKPPAKRSVVPPLDVRTAREKVSNQLANVNMFIDILGPIVQGIETLDESIKTQRLSQKTIDRNEANKQKVIEAIRNLRVGLSYLEAEFRAKISLQRYLPGIEGITELAAGSEDAALAGRFVASKEPLRNVARKLTDTLATLPR